MKNRCQSTMLLNARVRAFLFLLALCLLFPGIVLAGHKLKDKHCYDCHVVGGSLADVVTDSRLIRKTDSRMSQILANGWLTGTTVPCVYCHDTSGRGVRSNMVGVWNDFTTPTSKHPVDPYTSNYDAAKEGGDQTSLDCIDCHDMNVVYYVKGGPAPGTTLSPNIHGRDVSSVVSTPGPGLLTAADTWKNWSTAAGVSPYNAQGNTFCTRQCHNGLPGTGVTANRAAHGYTSPLVTLELPIGQLDTTINGCLDEGAGVGGCHSVHKASDNPDLITQKNAVGTTIRRTDCGACHVFDDPPASRDTSDWYSNGHGRFSTSNGITCLSCHDSAIPHFDQDGSANANSPNRLGFTVDSISSKFSSPAKSRLSICTTCHTGYVEHTSPASPYYPVGCLDCHDPHGYGVSGNVKMVRRVPPIAAPTSTISYVNSGDWYNSAQGGSDFTDWGCDNRDCHATIGSISSIMNTTTGTHGGGTGIKSGCANCHKHTGGEYSWAPIGCDRCHGGAGSYWPSVVGGDDGGATPNDAGRHGIHRQALETRLGYAAGTTNDGEQKTMCRYCHKVGDSDHTSSTRAEVFPAGYAKAIWDTPTEAPSETNASFTAGTDAGTCTNVDCHNNKTTAANFAWYASSTSTCTMCHDDVTQATTTTGETHTAHTGNQASYGATIDCDTCHVNGVVWGTTPPSTGHRNGSWTLSFGYPYGTWTGVSYAGSWAAGTRGGCGTNPCHNDGTGTGAPVQAGYAWGTTVSQPACGLCHSASPTTNAHGKHLAYPGVSGVCTVCHTSQTTVNHMNNTVSLISTLASSYTGSLNVGDGGKYGSCTAGACHDAAVDIAWNATPTNCNQCHYNSSDVNNFNGQDNKASVVGSGEWTGVGHGSKGKVCLDCHSLTSAGHDFSATLGSGSNPYRFDTSGGAFTCSNATVGCHQAGITGPATGLDISTVTTHSAAGMAAAGYSTKYAWSFTPECVNCHDPHGDGSNLSMIQSQLYDKEAFSVTSAAPSVAIDNTALVFTDDTTGLTSTQEGYADYTVYSSVCQECHEGTPGSTTTFAFVDDARANFSGHPGYVNTSSDNPGDCSLCHKHDSAFKPSGCNSCHGSLATGQYWPDGSGGSPAYVDDDAGSHDRHMLAVGQYLGYSDYTVTMYDNAQQKTICAFCHPTPGGPGHNQNTVGSPADRVDVLGDGFTAGTFTVFGVGAQTIKADTNNAAAYSQASETCSNVDCHYEKTTPAYGGSGWDGGDAAGNDPDCLTCHYYRDTGTYASVPYTIGDLPDAHQVHVAGILPPDNAQSHDYPCSYCHDVTGYTTAHTNGEIDLSDTGSPNQSVDGDPNDETITPSSTAVKYGAGSAATTCANFYCHGADFSAPTQGTNVSPIWNSQSTAYCSACHDVDTRSTSTFGQEFTQGRHRTHLSPGAPFVYGPPYTWHAASCSVCHGVEDDGPALTGGCNAPVCHPNNGFDLPGSANDAGFATFPSRDHVEGNFEVDFEGGLSKGWNDINDYSGTPGTLAVLGTAYNNGTDICNRCHSTATIGGVVGATLAKADWNSASYRIPCENCHNALIPARSTPVVGGIAAPGVGGDDTTYGAGITGHNRTGSVYPGSGNSPAGKACTTCHDNMKPHIDGVDGTSFSATDVRYADTINGVSMASATVAEDMCFACHQNTGTDAGVQVSDHGNMNASFTAGSTHDAQAESFAYRCDACHEPHGLTVNALSNPNIYMVKGSVEVKNYSVPGSGADETTVVPVVYEAKTGTNSLDDGLTQSNNMCVVCHTSANRPGSGTALTNPNGDGTHAGLDDYSNNEQGNDCSSCHQHDYDANPSGTADGFMPLQCNGCHGNPATGEFYPTSGGVNGTSYPNRKGLHDKHVLAIANANSFSTTTTETCIWCHPGGTHSGDQTTPPADLHDGTTTQFLNIIGNTDDGTIAASAQQSGANTVGCSGVDCHYETDLPDSGWYGGASASCDTCHFWTRPYPAGILPNAHDIHVDEVADFGYQLDCIICHPSHASPSHENGIVEVNFPSLSPTNGNEAAVAGTGPLAGAAKFGGGTSTDYPTCVGIYCHGDFADGGIGGGNVSNAPNWGVSSTGACGTCHGDPGKATDSLKAAPITGSSGTIHPNHVSMAVTTPSVNCTVCHFDDWGKGTNGTYGNYQRHANGAIEINLNNRYSDDPGSIIVDYESASGSLNSVSGNYTCSNIVCHNGVTTPVWSDASIPGFGCGDCHHDSVVSSSPRPTWEGSVGRSHAAHADTDGVYTDCANCHTAFSANYTATGGTNHQNLVVDIAPSGGSYAETLGGAGVDWSPGSDGIDNGTCSATSCHGTPATLPQWGVPGTVACGSCHSNGMPPVSGAHASHFADSDTDYSECIVCHGDNGDGYASGMGTHVNNIVDVAGSGVSWNNSGTAGTPGDDTCTTTVCHSPSGNPAVWGDGGKAWETSSSIGCDECHYWSATPGAANNSLDANSLSSTHGTHFDTGYYCTDCHGALPVDDSHITSPVGSTDGQVLVNRANAVMDEASVASSVLGVGGSDPDPGNAVCDNTLCHNPSNDSHAATWQTSTASCSLCHADTTTGPLSGSHSAHIAATVTYGRVIVCGDCHTVPGAAAYGHRDGTVNLSALAGTGYQGSPSYPFGAPYGSCDTTTCHNDGTGVARSSPVWGTTVSQPACGLCHSASPVTVAHGKHLANPAYSCPDCHDAASSTSMSGRTTHINNDVTMANRAASYSGTTAVGDGGLYGNCAVGACHDVAVDIAWNATPTNCDQCHYNSSDVNNFNGRDKTASVVGSGEWMGVGHGSKGKVCLDCHSLTSAGHDFSATLGSGSNPYRFDTSGGAFTCSNATVGCHQVGITGPATGLDISTVTTHSSAEMVAAGYSTKYAWSFAPECVNCHDPHGDGSNLSMIQSQLYDKEAFSVTSAAPSLAIDNTTLVFTDDTTGLTSTQDGYADYTVYSSVCQECHEGTTPGTDTTFAFMDDARANFSGHPGYVNTGSDNPGDCSLCHKHDSAFKPLGCSGCHGNAGNDTYWPDDTPSSTYPDRAGRHAKHISALQGAAGYTTNKSNQKEMCGYCHNDTSGIGGSTHADYISPADVGSFNPIWDSTAVDPGSTYNYSLNTCVGINCHNNKTTASNFAWYASSTSTCTMCHDDVTQATTTTGETHTAHTGNQAAYGATIDCNTCHVNGVVWGTTPPSTGHRNGSWTLSFGYPYGTWTGVSYAGSWAAGIRGGCGTNPCHNDGTGTGAPVRAGYAWGTSMANDCASCHHGAGMASNKHGQHLASNALPGTALTFNTTDECVTCHSGTTTGGGVASGASHINAVRDVSFAASFGYEGGAASRINTGAATTCSTVRCHNGVGTPSWSTASVINCGECHHDLNLASSPRPTWEGSVGRSHAAHADTDGVYTDCADCHTAFSANYTATGGTNHQNLVVNIVPSGGSYAETYGGAGVDWSSGSDGVDNGTCSNTGCHGSGTPQWGNPASVQCGSCHGKTVAQDDRSAYYDTGVSVQGAPPFDLAGGTTATLVGKHLKHVNLSWNLTGSSCDLCHNGAGQGTVQHADGTPSGNATNADVSFNIAAGASATYDGTSCSNLGGSCHGGSQPWDSTVTLTCIDCHTTISTHMKTTKGGADVACEQCHPGGTSYPIRHSDNASPNVVFIPNYAQVGLSTAYGGVHLGGDYTAAWGLTTEAQICWRCHDQNNNGNLNDAGDVSEWGTNVNLSTGNLSYNYGALNQTNWLGATWTSGTSQFSYKTGTIKSTHSANPAGTARITGTAYSTGGMIEALDAVGNIRCSYCHDIHERALAPGDTAAGRPYLRGTWKGNPYKEDGAPQIGMNGWAVQGPANRSYGLVPRASASTTNNGGVGGYWIDQNSGNPNSGETFAGTAGLCSLCHGTDVDSMDRTTGEGLWVGTNGHSNAVIGGTGANKANIFTRTNRGQSNLKVNPRRDSTFVDMGLYSETNRGYSYRGIIGYGYNPLTDGSGGGSADGYRAYAFQQFTWGSSAGGSTPGIASGTAELIPDDGTSAQAQTQYHTFNCGKCHNPHASRLPKLMITNCLDNNHNTWQDGYQTDTTPLSTYNNQTFAGERASNWPSAQNCHRRGPVEATGETGSGTTFGPGWNKVTPW